MEKKLDNKGKKKAVRLLNNDKAIASIMRCDTDSFEVILKTCCDIKRPSLWGSIMRWAGIKIVSTDKERFL